MTEPTTPVSVPTDDLRKQVNELGALAQDLFEAQFARYPGGRMPADPTWDDLEPSERDEFWEQARNARHVFVDRVTKAVNEAHTRGYDEGQREGLADRAAQPGTATDAQTLWYRLEVAARVIKEFKPETKSLELARFLLDIRAAVDGDLLEDEDTGKLLRFAPGQGRLLTALLASQAAEDEAGQSSPVSSPAPEGQTR